MRMPFGSLWLPVLVAAVVVFVASSILHMVVRHHRADYSRLTDEDGIGAVLRKERLSPGLYVIPYCSDMKQMKDPAFMKKYEEGPVALISVLKNQAPPMGKLLGLWFVFCALVSFFTAYVARNTLDFATDGMLVLRITTAVAFAGYGLGAIQDSIWKAVPWSNTLRFVADALIYASLTGLVFMWLWPGA
jgi:hypothetical protein